MGVVEVEVEDEVEVVEMGVGGVVDEVEVT